MKRIKNNYLKIAILLIVTGSMAFLYWLYSPKQFDNKSIPKDADAIAIIDVKNIRNQFIFSYLKNPSQWKFYSNNSENKKRFDLSNYGIETTDYVSFFHIQKQPLNQWCFVAKIENETKFEKALRNFQFVKTKSNQFIIIYFSKTLNTNIIQYKNQILYCTNTSKNQQNYIRTAEDLFIKQNYFDSKKIENILKTQKEVVIWIQKNNFLAEDAIINISLKENEILADGQLNWKSKYKKPMPFLQNSKALFSLGFNFDMIRNQDILKNHSVKINKMIGFNLDSILIHHPTQTELILHNIIEKKDSAITYDYDDDFNPIKKVVVQTNREPSFYFSMQTDDSKKVYNYLKSQNVIDKDQIFLNFPLAKTKATIQNNTFLLGANLDKIASSKSRNLKIGYLQININKIQAKDWRFLITKNKNLGFFKPFKTLEINLVQKNNSGYFQATLKTNEDQNLYRMMN